MPTMGQQEFTTPGAATFNVPAGVYWVWVTAVAGGGGGASSIFGSSLGNAGGGGGGGEGCDGAMVYTTPGGTLTLQIGTGGAPGQYSTVNNATNTFVGPKGTQSGVGSGNVGATATSGDTVIGPIRLEGGYGGAPSSSGHGGIGGGADATIPQAVGGAGNGNQGLRISGAGGNGFRCTRKDGAKFWGGGGGQAGSAGAASIARGGGAGQYFGGLPGGDFFSGGGGGASILGPGGDGALIDTPGSAPASGYGGGGGGGGANSTTGSPNRTGQLGGAGANGYILLMWVVSV